MSLYCVVTGRLVGMYYTFPMTPTSLPGAVGIHIGLWPKEFKLPSGQHTPLEPEAEVVQILEAPCDLQAWRI